MDVPKRGHFGRICGPLDMIGMIFKDKQEFDHFECHRCSDHSSGCSGGLCGCSEEGTFPELWFTGQDGC